MDDIEYKRLAGATLGEGTVEALFATFGNVDRVNDIVAAGAIRDGVEVPMVWHHRWDEPVGKGVVRAGEREALFRGTFFLDTVAGQEAYKSVRAMGDLQQWSFGFRVLTAAYEERDGELVRIIKALELFEVSPVLVGANPKTGTLSVKGLTAQQRDVERLFLEYQSALARMRGA